MKDAVALALASFLLSLALTRLVRLVDELRWRRRDAIAQRAERRRVRFMERDRGQRLRAIAKLQARHP
jgi:hypothetical protein